MEYNNTSIKIYNKERMLVELIRNKNMLPFDYYIEELKQQDCHGKRVYVQIEDTYGNKINNKIDVGVHKKFEIEQEKYCFDITLNNEGANLLINSNEQRFTEKLRSLLKFGSISTRYNNIFDMYYFIDKIDKNKLEICLESYIFQDDGMH